MSAIRDRLRLRCPTLGTSACLAIALIATAAPAANPPGFFQSTVALEGPPVGLAFDTNGVLYALEEAEFNANQTTVRAILPNGTIAGSFAIAGDDPDNFFVGGMTFDPITDRLLITDNTADGRLYAVSKSGVLETIATGIPAIAVPIVRSTGEIFVSTAVGNNTGQVLQVNRTTGATSVVMSGLDYGAGLAFDDAGDLIVLDADHATFRGRLQRVPITKTPEGLSFGTPTTLFAETSSSYGVVVDSEGDLFGTGAGGLYSLSGAPPTETLFYSDNSISPIATAIAFGPGSAAFEPFAGPGGGRIAINANFGHAMNDLFVTILTPAIPGDYDGNGEVTPADYDIWRIAYGSSNLAADGNRDGVVDAADYTVWRNHVGHSIGSGGITSVAVPEPCGAILVAWAFALFVGIVWRVQPIVFLARR